MLMELMSWGLPPLDPFPKVHKSTRYLHLKIVKFQKHQLLTTTISIIMKFYFAAILLSVGAALADTVGFQVKMSGQYDQQMVCLPVDGSSDRLYVPGNYDSYMFLDPIFDEESGLTTLATLEDTPKYVNVNADGFLVLADTGYGFNDTFESPNLQNVFINGLDTFYLVKNADSYSIKVSEEQPEGSIPINLGQTGVASMIKRNRLGQELHFIRRT